MTAEVIGLETILLDCCSSKASIINYIKNEGFVLDFKRQTVPDVADIMAYKRNNNLFIDTAYWIYIDFDEDILESVTGRVISEMGWF